MFRWIIDRLFGRAGEVRSYGMWDAAATVPRINQWGGPAASPNMAWDNPALMRARAESEFRNNPIARKAIDILVNAGVGSAGINPVFKSKATQAVWESWTRRCDVTGRHDWASFLAAALQAIAVSGEVFVVLNVDEAAAGVPIRIQLLGPEYLDTSRTSGDTYAGVQYMGSRPTGYWLYRQHPAIAGNDLSSVFISAETCFHVYRAIAPGATRGQSWLAPVLIALRELNEYLEAMLARGKVSALFAGYVKTPDGSNPLANSKNVPLLDPGTMSRLFGNEEVVFSDPPDAGPTFDTFVKGQLRRIAAGVSVPYELLAGDHSSITFASGRHGLLELQRHIEVIQYGMMVPQLCERLLSKWLAIAAALGLIESVDETPRWIAPRVEMLDPGAEVRAKVAEVRAGFTPRSEIIAARGWRAEDVDAEIAADNARADRLGLVLDTDPRKVTSQGQAQQGPESTQEKEL